MSDEYYSDYDPNIRTLDDVFADAAKRKQQRDYLRMKEAEEKEKAKEDLIKSTKIPKIDRDHDDDYLF